MTPLISVVIVAHDSWPYVGACIRSLYDHPPAELPFEVVLIDNASSDGTTDRVRALFPAVRVIASPHNDGYGVAVNRAMRKAVGDYLVLLNPDCEVTPGSLDTMVHFLDAAPRAGIVGPRLVRPTGEVQPSGRRFPSPRRVLLEVLRLHRLMSHSWRADHLLGTYWDQSTTRRVDWVSGACHVLRREVWDDVGPLTEKTFCGFDDFDYCFRAAESGLETWLFADATVLHHGGMSVNARWAPAQVDELAMAGEASRPHGGGSSSVGLCDHHRPPPSSRQARRSWRDRPTTGRPAHIALEPRQRATSSDVSLRSWPGRGVSHRRRGRWKGQNA